MKRDTRTPLVLIRGNSEAEPTVKTAAAEPTVAGTFAANKAYLAANAAYQDRVAREYHAMMAEVRAATTYCRELPAARQATERRILQAACDRVQASTPATTAGRVVVPDSKRSGDDLLV